MKRTLYLILFLTVMLGMTAGAWADIHYVTSPGTAADIRSAIISASNGDIVEVGPGTYVGNVTIDKNITLISTGGATETIIDGNYASGGQGTIYLPTGRDCVTIGSIGHGFTILGFDGTSHIEKAAVYLQGTQSNITIEGNIIEARGDAGLMGEYNAANTNVVINSNQFTGQTFNGANPAGVGFGAQETLLNVPRQLIVFGGGGGTTNTQNFTFTNNTISGVAGGMSITADNGSAISPTPQGNTMVTLDLAGTNVITGNIFSGTTARYAEALRVRGAGSYTISGNNFNGSYPIIFSAGTTNAALGIARTGAAWMNNTFSKAVVVQDLNGNIKINTILTTILDGVASAAPTDIVKVAAGTYNENVTINKAVTLSGANADIPYGLSRGPESIVQDLTTSDLPIFTTASDNVTINGFEIIDPWTNSAIDAGLAGYSNWNIKFNYIHNVGILRGSSNIYAVRYMVGSGVTSNVNISDNYINEVANTTTCLGNNGGIWFGQSTSNGSVSNLTIERNTITNVKSALSTKNAWGISIGTGWLTSSTGVVISPVISHNTISGITGGLPQAIDLEGRTPGAQLTHNVIDNITSTVTPAYSCGVYVASYNSGSATIVINNNSLTNVYYGVVNLTTNTIDATQNWWGNASGPYHATTNPTGTGVLVSNNVRYVPWWANTEMTNPYSPPVHNTNLDTYYSTIQAAITAANPNNVINVAAGTYNESIIINKGISLLGAGASNSIIDCPVTSNSAVRITTLTGNVKLDGFKVLNSVMATSGHYQISVTSGSVGNVVEISNNNILGSGIPGEAFDDYAFTSQGTLSNLLFKNNTVSNCESNVMLLERHLGSSEISENNITSKTYPAIYYMTHKNPDDILASVYEVTTKQWVHDNIINAGGASGVSFVAPWASSGYNQYLGGKYSNIEISDNTITNVGGDYGSGIQLSANGDNGGIFDAVVTGNHITGINNNVTRGIRMIGNVIDATITENTITGLYRGVWQCYSYGQPGTPGASGNIVNNNSITGCTWGVENQYTTTDNVVDATRNYWGSIYGPSHATNPFNLEPTIGNPVSDNVTFMPFYATATTTPDREYVAFSKVVNRAVYTVYTSDNLAATLLLAGYGDKVILASTTFTGNFTVPAGVSLEAAEGETPIIAGTTTLNGGDITVVGITMNGGDAPAVNIPAGVNPAGTSISSCSIEAGSTGVAIQNSSIVNIAIENNYWGATPNFTLLLAGQVAPIHYVTSETAGLYVSAPATLLKGNVPQTYSVKIDAITGLRMFAIQVKYLAADFGAATGIALGSSFIRDNIDTFLDETNETVTELGIDYNMYTVTGGFTSNQNDVEGENLTLFTFSLTSLNHSNIVGSPITLPISEVVMYNPAQPPIPIICQATTGLDVIIDANAPALSLTAQTAGVNPTLPINHAKSTTMGYAAVENTYLQLSATDNYKLDNVKFKIQVAGTDAPAAISDFAAPIETYINSTTWTEYNSSPNYWLMPDRDLPSLPGTGLNNAANVLPTGSYTIYVMVSDRVGNFDIKSWNFKIDKSAPNPITWGPIVRTTPDQNNKIDLSWAYPTDASKIHVWAWNAYTGETNVYPYYLTAGYLAPTTAPNPYGVAVQGTWSRLNILTGDDMVTTVNPWPQTIPTRGYYYLTAFVEDAAGNMSAAPWIFDDPDYVNDYFRESISYWPGDVYQTTEPLVPLDGQVLSNDIVALSAVWGTNGAANPVCNVGPTIDHSRRGRPTPDARINIEDLMIFAMNYENTDYLVYDRSSSIEAPELSTPPAPVRIELNAQVTGSQMIVTLNLAENIGLVKGVNVPVLYGSGLTVESVTAGEIWMDGCLFFNTNNNNVVEVSGSYLGSDTTINGNGIIATIVFNITGEDTNIELQHMIARTVNNNEIGIVNNPAAPTGNEDPEIVIPVNTFLGSNYPNPFNPTTTIQFGLKDAGSVKVTIYNTRGQVVRTLVDAAMKAGTHRVVWNGMDNNNRPAASGVYFYKMETKGFSKINKALLLK